MDERTIAELFRAAQEAEEELLRQPPPLLDESQSQQGTAEAQRLAEDDAAACEAMLLLESGGGGRRRFAGGDEDDDGAMTTNRRPRGRRGRARRGFGRGLNAAQRARLGEANVRFGDGDFAEAARLAADVTREAPHAPDAYLTLANVHEQWGNAAMALQLEMIAALSDPHDPDAWRELVPRALALFRREQPSEQQQQQAAGSSAAVLAEFCLDTAVKRLPGDAELLLLRAQFEVERENYAQAAEDARRALALIDSPVAIPSSEVSAMQQKEQQQQQQQQTQRPRQLDKKEKRRISDQATKALAKALSELRRRSEAMDLLRQAISAHEKEVDAGNDMDDAELRVHLELVYNLTELMRDGNEFGAIVELVEHTRSRLPRREQLPTELSVCYGIGLLGLGKVAEGVPAALGPLFNVDPEEYGILYLDVADACAQAGELNQAISVLDTLCGTHTWNREDVWQKRAECHRKLGQLDSAAVWLERIMEREPLNIDTMMMLCSVYEAAGKNGSVMRSLDQFLDAYDAALARGEPVSVPLQKVVLVKVKKANVLYQSEKYLDFATYSASIINDCVSGKFSAFSQKTKGRADPQKKQEGQQSDASPGVFLARGSRRRRVAHEKAAKAPEEHQDAVMEEAAAAAAVEEEVAEEEEEVVEEEEEDEDDEEEGRSKRRKEHRSQRVSVVPETTAPPPPLSSLPSEAFQISEAHRLHLPPQAQAPAPAEVSPSLAVPAGDSGFQRLRTMDEEEEANAEMAVPMDVESGKEEAPKKKRRGRRRVPREPKQKLFPLVSILGIDETLDFVLKITKALSMHERTDEAMGMAELGVQCAGLLDRSEEEEEHSTLMELRLLLAGLLYTAGYTEEALADIQRHCLKAGIERVGLWNLLNEILTKNEMYYGSGPQRMFDRHLKQRGYFYPMQIMAAHHYLLSRSYVEAMGMYRRVLEDRPNDALAHLALGICLVQQVLNRRTVDKHGSVLKGIAELREYARIRGEKTPEVLYNLARAHQVLGINHIAERLYRELLALEAPELKMEAAFNLVQLYREAGSLLLARQVLETYLVF